jgi:hypothetical protein
MGTKISLYDITEEFKAVDEMLEMDNGEITEDHESIMALLNDMLKNKTDNCCEYAHSIDTDNDLVDAKINILKEKIEAFNDIKKRNNAKKERYINYLMMCMDKLGKDKFIGAMYAIKKKKGSVSVDVLDVSLLPDDYVVTKEVKSADKIKIKKELKAGKVVVGAILKTGKESLTFKAKSQKD